MGINWISGQWRYQEDYKTNSNEENHVVVLEQYPDATHDEASQKPQVPPFGLLTDLIDYIFYLHYLTYHIGKSGHIYPHTPIKPPLGVNPDLRYPNKGHYQSWKSRLSEKGVAWARVAYLDEWNTGLY
ncbi:hypothetical protein Lal_00040474 [Lupinus albus]|nr:hypothetical protein Lal_00040474 [Lupinus albus]